MITPLFKKLKPNGTTNYTFKNAEFDNIRVKNTPGIKMYFSKFVLLNLPVGNDWDFNTNFFSASDFSNTGSFSDKVVNSLRNYVSNQEVTIRNTKLSQNEFFYNTSVNRTPSERIFFKWLKKLDLIDFESAIEGDQYIQFSEPNDSNDLAFHPEYLWQERRVFDSVIGTFKNSDINNNFLDITYLSNINYKVGDIVIFKDVPVNFPNVSTGVVTNVVSPNRIIFNVAYTGSELSGNGGSSALSYHRVVEYIGEIQGSNNVVSVQQAYVQTFAGVNDSQGATPDILFKTVSDANYAPNLNFPILPSQFQSEILGAQNNDSPINRFPSDYPGDRFAIYDSSNPSLYRYVTSSGDILRRTGSFFGVSGGVNNPTFNSSNLDGIALEFDLDKYSKANYPGLEVSNFDELNTLEINNITPSNFEFNTVLWYYTIENEDGISHDNLYSVSFLDNPVNNKTLPNSGFPTVSKLVSTDNTSGSGYNISLNEFTSVSGNTPTYSSEQNRELQGFEYFSESLKALLDVNGNVTALISSNKQLLDNYNNIKQLLYTQTSLDSINKRFTDMDRLLRLYSTLQIEDSDSIMTELDQSQTPPVLKLNSVQNRIKSTLNFNTTSMYDTLTNNIIEQVVDIPFRGGDTLIYVKNDDVSMSSSNSALSILLNKDLGIGQSVKIIVDGSFDSVSNKRLNISMNYLLQNQSPSRVNILDTFDLPVFFNDVSRSSNLASLSKRNIYVDINSVKRSLDGEALEINVDKVGGIKQGDTIILNNFSFNNNNNNNNNNSTDLSGQYVVANVNNNTILIDILQYPNIDTFITTNNILSNSNITSYDSFGSISLNKGFVIDIFRVDEEPLSTFADRYKVIVHNN